MMVDMKVSGLTIDPFTNMPILVLKDCDGKNAMPIWIGLIEASAIATELERIQLKRPMTHDLMHNMLGHVGARIDRIEVHDLRDNTFYAMIVLTCADGKIVEIDSRPSDAIALALRAQAPIRVARKVIDRARKMDLRLDKANGDGTNGKANGKSNGANGKSSNGASSKYSEFLENLSDDDFGKWKM